MRIIKILLLIVILHILYFQTSFAEAEEVSLSTSPSILRIETKRGVTIDAPFRVENLSASPVNLSITYRAFTAADSADGQVAYTVPDDDLKQLLAGTSVWENDSPVSSIDLAAKQKKNLKLHIVILPNTAEKDYYFSTILSTSSIPVPENFTEKDSTYLQVHGAFATNVLLSIGQTKAAKIALTDFSSPVFLQQGPVAFRVLVKNNGNRLVRPRGTIRVTNMFGQLVGKINLDEVNVLARTNRYLPAGNFFTKSQKGDVVPGVLWNEAILLGPYTAKLELSYPDSNEKIEKTIRFFALPYNRLGAVFLAGVVITAIILKVRKRMNR